MIYEHNNDLYLLLEGRLEKIYEEISGDFVGKFGLVNNEVLPDSEIGRELSRRWREYLNGIGVEYTNHEGHGEDKVVLGNPLYTEHFNKLVMTKDTALKILAIGLP